MNKIYNALFTGQGAQYVGMLDECAEDAGEILNTANEILGYDLWEVSRDKTKIYETKYSQPLNFVYEYIKFKQLTERFSWRADMMLGHSMGEFAALTCAEVLSFRDGLELISKRAEIMSGVQSGFRMVSVIGIDISDVEKLCDAYAKKYNKRALISNCNGKLQTIITIEEKEVENFGAIAKEKYKDVIIKALALPYPFHTAYMKKSADEFCKYVEKANFLQPQCRLILNANGRVYTAKDLNILKKYMIEQMYMPVRFTDCMKQGLLSGTPTWVEFGPKEVLAKMLKREYNQLQVFHVDEILRRVSMDAMPEGESLEENAGIDRLGRYLYLLSSKGTKTDNADYGTISSKYRLLKKLYLSFENEQVDGDITYQMTYARTLFEEAMHEKGYTEGEIVKLI